MQSAICRPHIFDRDFPKASSTNLQKFFIPIVSQFYKTVTKSTKIMNFAFNSLLIFKEYNELFYFYKHLLFDKVDISDY